MTVLYRWGWKREVRRRGEGMRKDVLGRGGKDGETVWLFNFGGAFWKRDCFACFEKRVVRKKIV